MKAWDEIWKTEEGRAFWLEPEPFVLSLLPRLKEEGIEKVLDLGFGLGRHAVLLAKEKFDVYGIDTSPAGLDYATEWSARERVRLKLTVGEMSHLPFSSDFFDLIVAWNVIYHGTADYIRKTVGEIGRCLSLGGYLLCTLISTKNSNYGLGEEVGRDTFVIAGHEEKSYPHHYFDREEINQYLKGFTLLKCKDVEHHYRRRSFHWHVLARLVSKAES